MPDETVAASGAQFARDLRQIRVQKDLTIQDIHNETRISVDLIASFEEHGLFEHPSFNQVYLRSFVRSYASTLGIAPDVAQKGLEAALQGRYGNQLAVKYLDAEPATPPVETPDGAGDDSSEGRAPQTKEAPAEPEPPPEQAPAPGDPITSSEARPSSFWPEGSRRGVLITLGVVGLLLLLWGLVSLTGTLLTDEPPAEPPARSTPDPAGSSVAVPDTASSPASAGTDTAPSDTAPSPSASSIALGDTMYFTLVAEGSPIEGIRIRRDDDLRRPYWIEAGQAAIFPAREEIVIEPLSDDYQLLLNGYRWPHESQEQLTITRADARSFFDSVATPPVELTIPADTNHIPGTDNSASPESR